LKLLLEEFLSLFQLRRVSRTQPLVNPQQGFFVSRGWVFVQGGEDQLVSDLDDYRHLLEHARVDAIDMFLTERNATLDIDLARFRVDDVPSYDGTFQSGTICGRHFDIFGRVEGSN